ncbi:MAG: dihydrolipoyl dehydrogenase [Clostridiaceae bacterium]|nr:dihydrolipoyl dehydrogenase [Clostridiaceae bacterium]
MDFDLIIIGAGPGGYVAAERAAELGLKTAIVEKEQLGGTCLNRGCMPTKALLHAAKQLSHMHSAGSLGLIADGVDYDFNAVQRSKNVSVDQLREGIAQGFKLKKVTHLVGTAQITAPNTVSVDGKAITAANILIATGSVPVRPPIPGLDLPGVVTSDELLSPEGRDFRQLVIIGGGVIGMEFAAIYRALGRAVTVIEAAPRLLPAMDREISQSLAMLLKKQGIEIALNARVERIVDAEDGLAVIYTDKKGEECRAEADGVLAAVGRRAYFDGLFADGLCPETAHGALVCSQHFETSIKGIFAVGDVIAGSVQLAHAASAQGVSVVHRLAGRPIPANLKYVPSCVYVDPEIASVGMTEAQAKAEGIPVLVGKTPTLANGKSLIEHCERGFIKLVFRAEDEVLIGAQLMCARATDLIAAPALAIVNGLTRRQFLQVILPHPTFSESLTKAAEEVRAK